MLTESDFHILRAPEVVRAFAAAAVAATEALAGSATSVQTTPAGAEAALERTPCRSAGRPSEAGAASVATAEPLPDRWTSKWAEGASFPSPEEAAEARWRTAEQLRAALPGTSV